MTDSNLEIMAIWDKLLNILKPQINEVQYTICFESAIPIKIDQNTFFIEVYNDFVKEVIEEKYKTLIEGILSGAIGTAMNLFVRVSENKKIELEKIPSTKKLSKKKTKKTNLGMPLNPGYTFNSFVAGKSNEFAYAVSKAVAESPGKKYNPLFIYGGVGLGKTHLLQAIGHQISIKKPRSSIIYVSAEAFMNEMISSIKENTTSTFKKKYRKVDLLLMDDIQFLAGKSSTQEEFFHTFNDLFQRNKQIVLSSDRPPMELNKLEDRLVSRFEHGLIADIQKPDLELRIAILKKEAEYKKVQVSEDMFVYIAEKVENNIREVQGAFTRIVAYSSMEKKEITKEFVDRILANLISAKRKKVNIDFIQNLVAEFYGVSVNDIISKKRSSKIALPRQIAIYLTRNVLDLPLQNIGEKFGGRDHTTIMHSITKIEKMMLNDSAFKDEIEDFEKKLSQ